MSMTERMNDQENRAMSMAERKNAQENRAMSMAERMNAQENRAMSMSGHTNAQENTRMSETVRQMVRQTVNASTSTSLSDHNPMPARCLPARPGMRLRSLAVLGLAATLVACSSAPEKTDTLAAKVEIPACVFPNWKDKEEAPEWVCTGNVDEELTAVGTFEPSHAGYDYRLNMAALRARHQLAEKLLGVQRGIARDMASHTGVGLSGTADGYGERVTSYLTSQTLRGTRIYASVEGPDGTLYVLVGVDKRLAAEQLKEASHSSYRQADAQWQEEKGRAALAEMDTAIDRHFGVPSGQVR